MAQIFLINLLVVLAYMSVWFLIARKRNRLDTVDNAWGGGFLALAVASALQGHTSASYLITWLVFLWAVRLTTHIARRNAYRPEDPRYVEISRKWKGNLWLRAFFSIFLLQGVLIWIIGLPISLSANGPTHLHGWLPLAGLIVWLIGQWTETIADRQLQKYLATKPDKSNVLDTGLWRYSRHPNYFGEILQWYGIAMIACNQHYGWIGLIGPTVLYFTIRYISGVPPIENKRQDNAAYQAYARRTSVIFPLPPRS